MNPLLETTGQIAAIVICLFVFVFVVLAVAFNLGMAFGMSWLAGKIHAIKMLRPTVESVNKATESALEGMPPTQDQHGVLHAVTSIPATTHNLEKKVDQGADKVADAVIEFRARTIQAKTIVKAFFLPGLMHKKQETVGEKTGAEANSSDYQKGLQEKKPAVMPVESPLHDGSREDVAPEEQVQHAAVR